MSEHLKEKWLLYRLKIKRDPDAYAEIYDLYAPRIYRFIYFKVPSSLDAEDLTAEVFLKVWQFVNEKGEIEKLGGLLYKIARNLVIDFYRKRKKQEIAIEDVDEVYLQRLSDAGQAVEKMALKSEAQEILKSLRLLKEEYREVLTLRYIDGLDHSEIAAILGKSYLNTRVLNHRALKTLRKILEQNLENNVILQSKKTITDS